jgi:2-keto-4-pentenoate hydratase/2-oxohepta-3-ene-1,7-dioic acid hydratase in catechol pathway
MTRLALSAAAAVLAASVLARSGALAQPSPPAPEPFAVATFQIDGAPKVGLVLRESVVVDIDAAAGPLGMLAPPTDMIDLITRYDGELRGPLYAMAARVVGDGLLEAGSRPAYVHDIDDVRTLPPIMYPGKILNAAVNFYTHVDETGTAEQRAEAQRQRREQRGVPYLFLKPSRGAVIGADDEIVLPYGRTQIDWEVELGAVIGQECKYTTAADAEGCVFGYMVTLDISDRGGRPPGGAPFTLDWLVGKGHDTFAPQGPWIVPREFYGDPMERLRQTLSVDGQVMQEGQAGDMIHSLWELIEYASSIVTLYPGDVLNNGTSGGVGMGTAVRGEQRFLQDGETVEAGIDGIGTMRLRVRRETSRPEGTGAQLSAQD